jgi:xanthine dehydrogenase YagR molybdenum-binding subunit
MRSVHPSMTRRTMMQATSMATMATMAITAGGGAPRVATAAGRAPSEPWGALGDGPHRAEGALKVTGSARYAIDNAVTGLVYGVLVQSTIAAGRIKSIDAVAARAAPGVLQVFTHESRLKIRSPTSFMQGGAATEVFVPLQDDLVRWNGQHIAFVVAETFEQATEAASLVKVRYEERAAILQPDDSRAKRSLIDDLGIEWGDAHDAMASAPVKVEATYKTPREYNSPLEPHACIAAWLSGHLTVWEPSQWVGGARHVISQWMQMNVEDVRVVSPHVGGGFGSKVAPHPHVALACASSRLLGRPVKVSLTRPQTFTGLGGRPRVEQRLSLGADDGGQLLSIIHEGWNETAIDDIQVEPSNAVTAIMYGTPNLWSRHGIVALNTVNPGWMRAPGENPSAFALEVAMDELACALPMDPIALRLKNWADLDQHANLPWSTRRLREAYAAGASAFGWSRRSAEPRSMRQGHELIGWGMAGGTYPVRRTPGEAKIVFHADGRIEVLSSGVDIGTGTYTILAQTAAEVLRVATSRVTVQLGDTTLPRAPLAGGSQLANLLTAAVHATAVAARHELLTLATSHPKSPFNGAKVEEMSFEDGGISLSRRPGGQLAIGDLLTATGRDRLEVHRDTFKPSATEDDRNAADRTFTQMLLPTDGGFSSHSWSAHFVEVRVDEDLGTVRVKRMVGAFDSGRLYNPRLARSQWIGGMIMGIGQALHEEGQIDPRDGRVTNANLADYAVPVNADVPDIQVIDVGSADLRASALGGKAVGEIGIVGVAAAIANAVYHATGKRIRDLPITIEKLIG